MRSLSSWVQSSMLDIDASSAEFTHEIAETAYSLPEPFHQDPADRILAATAIVGGLQLMTADREMIANRKIPTIDAQK